MTVKTMARIRSCQCLFSYKTVDKFIAKLMRNVISDCQFSMAFTFHQETS